MAYLCEKFQCWHAIAIILFHSEVGIFSQHNTIIISSAYDCSVKVVFVA